MSHSKDNNNASGGIRVNAPKEGTGSSPDEDNKKVDNADALVSGGAEESQILQLQRQLTEANQRVNELTAFLYNLLEQYQNDFIQDSSAFMSRATVSQQIRAKLKMTPQMFEIISKSREQAEQFGQQ